MPGLRVDERVDDIHERGSAFDYGRARLRVSMCV